MVNGISIKLNLVFGDNVKIYYDEDVKQGLTEPCFFIMVLNPSENKMLGSRAFRNVPFNVHYFPAVNGSNLELQTMASDLYEAMRSITLVNGDIVNGSRLRHEVNDGILHFFVNFNMFINYESTDELDMETLTVNNSVKG
jgi:hypothetical protein